MAAVALTRVGVKFDPPTLAVEYKHAADEDEQRLQVKEMPLTVESGDDVAMQLLRQLQDAFPDFINEHVANLKQVWGANGCSCVDYDDTAVLCTSLRVCGRVFECPVASSLLPNGRFRSSASLLSLPFALHPLS